VHLKAEHHSLAQHSAKVKTDIPKKNEKQLGSVQSVWWMERKKNYGRKDLWKRWVLSLEWKRGVMDGDSGDEGNDQMRASK